LSEIAIVSKLQSNLKEFGDLFVDRHILEIEEKSLETDNLSDISTGNIYIFQSKNAAMLCKKYKESFNRNSDYLAVGAYTASPVEEIFNVKCRYPDNKYSSADLLKSKYLKDVEGKKIIILKGENGLSILHENLREKNDSNEILLYKRKMNKYLLMDEDFKDKNINIVICMSNSVLNFLIENFHNLISNLKVVLVVPNKRFLSGKTNVFYQTHIVEKIDNEEEYLNLFHKMRGTRK
tara:strand:+ start:40540 stop:41247 length:708 start_codon:yes stop_codon:yes gene_type:complete